MSKLSSISKGKLLNKYKIFLIIILSSVLSFLWLKFSSFIPKPPENIAILIVNLFNAKTQEEVANIEIIYVFFISSIVSIIIVLFAVQIKKRLTLNTNIKEYKSKSKLLAILFNTLFPGLGYFYIGYFKKSLFFMTGIIILTYVFYYLTDYFKNAYIVLSLFPIIVLIYFYTIFDFIKIILKKEEKHYKINKWYLVFILIFLLSFLTVFIRDNSPIRYFKIPSTSMSSTIKQGDYIIVKKEFRKISREEILVFKYPLNKDSLFIKRVVAIGGDKIFIRNKVLYLQPHEGEEYIKTNYPIENMVMINNSLWVKNPYKESIKTIKNDKKIIANGTYPSEIFNFKQTIIPKDNYFVMGDNRDHSNDSRYWGYIQKQNIFGIFNGLIIFNYKDLSRINLKIK